MWPVKPWLVMVGLLVGVVVVNVPGFTVASRFCSTMSEALIYRHTLTGMVYKTQHMASLRLTEAIHRMLPGSSPSPAANQPGYILRPVPRDSLGYPLAVCARLLSQLCQVRRGIAQYSTHYLDRNMLDSSSLEAARQNLYIEPLCLGNRRKDRDDRWGHRPDQPYTG